MQRMAESWWIISGYIFHNHFRDSLCDSISQEQKNHSSSAIKTMFWYILPLDKLGWLYQFWGSTVYGGGNTWRAENRVWISMSDTCERTSLLGGAGLRMPRWSLHRWEITGPGGVHLCPPPTLPWEPSTPTPLIKILHVYILHWIIL